ncbi:unnamed protein product [Jaminaea pallidilutea]
MIPLWLNFLALASSGVTTGLFASYPLLINEHFRCRIESRLDPAQRLWIWHRAYLLGKSRGPASAVTAALSYLGCAWLSTGKSSELGVTRSSLFVLASVLHVVIVPFTLAVIMPVNLQLFEMLSKAESGQQPDVKRMDSLFGTWAGLHNLRVASTACAFGVGLLGVLS